MEPLRERSKDRQRAIIGHFECINIFMNIDQLVQVTEDFYNDLIQYDPAKQSLGDLCLSHVSNLVNGKCSSHSYTLHKMRRFTCYNRFLLGVRNAQIINEKQMKNNSSYFNFLEVNTTR